MCVVAAKARGSHLRVHFKVSIYLLIVLTLNFTVSLCDLLLYMTQYACVVLLISSLNIFHIIFTKLLLLL